MATPKQQIESRVDEAIANGAIPASERQATIEFLTKDQGRLDFFSKELAGGSYFGKKAREEADLRRKHEEDMKRERAAVQAERDALQAWSRDARAEVDRARAIQDERDHLLAENAAYKQVASDWNLDDQVVVPKRPERPQVPVDQRIQPTLDGRLRDTQTGKFVSEERATQAFQELIGLTSKAMAIQAEHQQLFGAPLTDSLMEEALAAGQSDIRQYWESKYNAPARRAELAEQARNQEIAKIREEERSKILSEMAVDPSKFGAVSSTGYQPSPLANTYMQSRAADLSPLKGEDGAPVAPEKKSQLAAAASSIQRSGQMFNKYFNLDGTPRSGVRPPDSYGQNMAYQDQ